MSKPNPTANMQRVEFQLSEEVIRRLDEIAHELSEPGPGGNVTRADVLREASADFVVSFDPSADELTAGLIGTMQDDTEVDA